MEKIDIEKNEKFKPIIGYEWIYWIDGYGNIYSKNWSGHFLKPEINRDGYLRVSLSKNGIVTRFFVHRLVALHFLTKDEKRNIINHIDGNRKNNHLNNIEYVTSMENRCHSNNNTKSGLTGVSLDNKSGNWRSRCVYNGIRHHLGCFVNKEDAYQARVNFEKENGIINKYL